MVLFDKNAELSPDCTLHCQTLPFVNMESLVSSSPSGKRISLELAFYPGLQKAHPGLTNPSPSRMWRRRALAAHLAWRRDEGVPSPKNRIIQPKQQPGHASCRAPRAPGYGSATRTQLQLCRNWPAALGWVEHRTACRTS